MNTNGRWRQLKYNSILKLYRRIILLIVIIFIFTNSLHIIFMNSNFYMTGAASTWTQTSDKDFDNGTSNNLTIVGGGDAAELQIDLSEIKHWTDKTPIPRPPSNYPTGRSCHTMAPVWGTDKTVMFGGAYPINNETWVYDLSDNTWQKRSSKGPSSPCARYKHSMVSIPGTDKILVFGGISDSYSYLNDTWVYSYNKNTWEENSELPGWK